MPSDDISVFERLCKASFVPAVTRTIFPASDVSKPNNEEAPAENFDKPLTSSTVCVFCKTVHGAFFDTLDSGDFHLPQLNFKSYPPL